MPTKRGNSEGSITRRPDGRWEARLSLPDGKRKSFYAKTRQEAARRLAEAIRDRDKGLPIVGDRQMVADYLQQWLAMIEPSVTPRSLRRYREQVRLHLIPALGQVSLAKLTPQHLQMLYAQKLADGLSPATVRLMHAVLHRALETAVRLDLVQRNIADRVDLPRKRRHEMAALSTEQVRTFLAAVSGDRLEALYILALTTGMRQGELLALRWREVDLEAGSLQVRTTLQKLVRKWVFATPKTSRSRRKIAMTAFAVNALQRHRIQQLDEQEALGPAWKNKDLVFTNTVGGPIDRIDLVRRYFHPLLDRAGLPRVRFHDLRHTAATLLLEQGIHPKVVAEMLGHTTINMTLDIYSHVLPDMQREATAALDRLFAPNTP